MLNYLWSGLIIISIVFAFGNDIHDEFSNTYNNGQAHTLTYLDTGPDNQVTLQFNESVFYGRIRQRHTTPVMTEIIIPVSNNVPAQWQLIALHQHSKNKDEIRAQLISINRNAHQLDLILPEVHWVKLSAITNAAFDMAEFAVKLALGLAGIMALWLGLMQIAEKSGLIFIFVRLIQPALHWLFPDIPRNHPALGSISLNLAANVLGLGNAATPLGIKAMQQLQTLNTKQDEASDAMCMFLALNTSSVQLLPPVTLIALMGAQVSELILPIILATFCSTVVAITVAKTYARFRSRPCSN